MLCPIKMSSRTCRRVRKGIKKQPALFVHFRMGIQSNARLPVSGPQSGYRGPGENGVPGVGSIEE